jgi:hypothetical protein
VRQQARDVFLGVDNADHDGSVARELPQAGVAHACAGAVAFDAAIDDRSGEAQLLAFGDDRLVQGLALPFVALAKVDAQHPRLELLFHRFGPCCDLNSIPY